jgi:hypothetical protein
MMYLMGRKRERRELNLTSSCVTGRCDVFLRFSMTVGSRLRSFWQPTRMMGRPAQKCLISGIHCEFNNSQYRIVHGKRGDECSDQEEPRPANVKWRQQAFTGELLTTPPRKKRKTKKKQKNEQINSPCAERYPTNPEYAPQNRSKSHANAYNSTDGVDRNLRFRRYPTRLARRACHLLPYWHHSCRRWWRPRTERVGGW